MSRPQRPCGTEDGAQGQVTGRAEPPRSVALELFSQGLVAKGVQVNYHRQIQIQHPIRPPSYGPKRVAVAPGWGSFLESPNLMSIISYDVCSRHRGRCSFRRSQRTPALFRSRKERQPAWLGKKPTHKHVEP